MAEFITHYSPDTDMTFITKETYGAQGDCAKTEVVGFYWGEPNENDTKHYIEHPSLVANYEYE